MQNVTLRSRVLPLWLCFICSLVVGHAHATVIDFAATQVAGNHWRYDYRVSNNSLADPIGEFTIFFDRSLYANLSVVASPSKWDSIVAQPDLGLPSDGFFDSLALSDPIAAGDSLDGFSAEFDYLGEGTPGVQRFEILNENFEVVDGGRTGTGAGTVSEPTTASLMLLGIMIAVRKRRAINASQNQQ